MGHSENKSYDFTKQSLKTATNVFWDYILRRTITFVIYQDGRGNPGFESHYIVLIFFVILG